MLLAKANKVTRSINRVRVALELPLSQASVLMSRRWAAIREVSYICYISGLCESFWLG